MRGFFEQKLKLRSYRRRVHIQNVGQGGGVAVGGHNRPQRDQMQNAEAQNFHRNLVHNISQAVLDAFNNTTPQNQGSNPPNRPRTASNTNNQTVANQAGDLGSRLNFPLVPVADYLQNMMIILSQHLRHDSNYQEGQSIFTDFIMLFSRHFTLGYVPFV